MGCRVGTFVKLLMDKGWAGVEGIDICEPFVRRAISSGLPVREGDVCHTRYEDGEFDVVYSRHVLEHVPDPMKMVEEQLRILRLGGVLVNHFPVGEPSSKHLSMNSGDDGFEQEVRELVAGKGELVFYGPSRERGFPPQGNEKLLVVRRG
jgi:SAM-dependent methyltransferase